MGQVDQSVLESIFSAAAVMASAEERGQYLREACGGDTELRRQVDALLRAHDHAGEFLATPALRVGRAAAEVSVVEGPGTSVGRYKLLQLIGEGGFGSVFMAEQEQPVRRKVALKVIKLGMDTRQVVARFEAERQALALMDHPNIARVLDAGATDSGRPYFVMELVNGVPITQFCDENRLAARQRLELFISVCNAVQHAHQKGVIHRDIKPSNVLVSLHDGKPVSKVIDFGIAKATQSRLTEKTVFTEFRQMVGTPEYMAPEQASTSGLDVDTRSDVYSLGVLLYELLTGTTPFDSKSLRSNAYAEIQRIIREVAPPRPSTRLAGLGERLTTVAAQRHTDARRLGTLVRGELDWIVMRCLEKDRGRRYVTAVALAEDLRRYLDSEPVLARPAGAAYRARKFVVRHRFRVAAAAAVGMALLLGFVGTTAGMLRARAAQRAAEASGKLAFEGQNAARAAQKLAEDNATAARHEARRATAVGNFARGVFALAQPETGDSGGEAKVSDLLKLAAAEIGTRLAGQPEEQVLARAMLAEAFQRLEQDDLALEQLRLAHSHSQSLPGGKTSEQTIALAADLVIALYVDGRGDEAIALARSTRAAAVQCLGDAHPVTWRATHALALALSTTGDIAASQELWQGLADRLRGVPEARTPEHLARYLSNLATCLRDRGHYDEALAAMKEAAEVIRDTHQSLGLPAAQAAAAQTPGGDGPSAVRVQLGRLYPDGIQSNAWMARLLVEAGRADEVTPVLEAYLNAVLLVQPQGTLTLSDRIMDLAHLKLLAGDRAAAGVWYARAVEMGRRLRPTEIREDNERWREWVMSCCSLPDGWASETLRQHVWGAVDDLLRDNAPGQLSRAEADVDHLRFRLIHWPGEVPTTAAEASRLGELIAEGSLAQLKAVSDPAPGIYLLGLEVPRPGSEPLRRAAWVLVAPWDLAIYPIPRFESVRTRLGPRWAEPVIARGEPAERRKTSALAMSDVLDTVRGNVRRLHWFAAVGTTKLNVPAGTYRISASADDGVRVYVDGKRVVDEWLPRQSTTDDAEVTLAAGSHELRVEFLQLMGAYNLWVQLAPRGAAANAAAASLGGGVPALEWQIGRVAAVMASRPDDARATAGHAHDLSRAGRFDEATAGYARALRLDPNEHLFAYALACLLAHKDDATAYREHCRAMSDRFGQTTDPIVAEFMVRALTLLPESGADDTQLASLAARMVDPGPSAGRTQWFHLARGVVEYRRGHFESAIEHLRDCQDRIGSGDFATLRARAQLFIAMSLHRLGRPDDARAAFEKVASRAGDGVGVARLDDLGIGGVDNWLSLQVTRREAAALIREFTPAHR